jgi:hypothetical protein
LPVTAFAKGNERDLAVRWWCRGKLCNDSFIAPDLSSVVQEHGDSLWVVVVQLIVDEYGRTQHAFLENGCGTDKIDKEVVRLMHRAMWSNVTERCGGIVEVSHGW